MKNEIDLDKALKELQGKIKALEARVQSIEGSLGVSREVEKIEAVGLDRELEISLPFKTDGSIEIGLGEYGMAWLGNIVLLFGITFLCQSLIESGRELISVFAAFASVLAVYLASYYSRKSYAFLSKLLLYNGYILTYYLTLRLSFFQESPLIENPIFVIAPLVLFSAFLLYRSYREESQFKFGFILVLLLVTGVVSNYSHLLLAFTVIASALSVLVYQRFNWIKLVFVAITIVYFLQFNWLVNNPIITGVAEFRSEGAYSIVYLLLNASLFSLLAVLPRKQSNSDELLLTAIVWNGVGFTTVLILTTVVFYAQHFTGIMAIVSVLCLLFSFVLKYRSSLTISASLYAVYAFISMSVFLYGIFLLPKAYPLLVLQSLLVVSIALWYRSRFLALANTFLFTLIVVLYLKDIGTNSLHGFVFIIVSFVSARIMNWKKERLKLKTEFIRNIYLFCGWIMTLVTFHLSMPNAFITVSWIGAALLFFLLSYFLRNIKYRWLAIATMVASAVNLVFADMKNMEITFRILVFLALAVILITVSVIYTKTVKTRKEFDQAPDGAKNNT